MLLGLFSSEGRAELCSHSLAKNFLAPAANEGKEPDEKAIPENLLQSWIYSKAGFSAY